MASGAARNDLLIDLQEKIMGLRTTVTELIDRVGLLHTDVAGLMAPAGGDYAGDAGPAVRARFYDHSRESNRIRMDGLNGMVAGLEATNAELANHYTNYTDSVD